MNAKETAALTEIKTKIDQAAKNDTNLESLNRLATFLGLPRCGGCAAQAIAIIQHPDAPDKVRALALTYYTRHAGIGNRWTLIHEIQDRLGIKEEAAP